MASTIIPVIELSMPPVTRVPTFAPLAMRSMVSFPVFSVQLPVVAEMVAIVMAVAGMPGRMSAATVIVCGSMKITAAQDNRVCVIRMDGRRPAQQQACGEEGSLKQGSGFHESDSFCGYLRKQ